VNQQARPCTETAGGYLGKTFEAIYKPDNNPNDEGTVQTGVILCPQRWAQQGLQVAATRALGYATTAQNGQDRPFVGYYNTVSGTLVHELVHVEQGLRPDPIANRTCLHP